MIKNVFVYSLLVLQTLAFAQVGGQSVYQFLNLVPSARQAALGGKNVTIYDQDVNQALFNPASINDQMDNHLSTNYASYFGDVRYGTAAYAHTVDRHLQTFHAGVQYINYGDFDGYDQFGNATSSFTGSEIALSVGYAMIIPKTNWHVGVNTKLISSTLESYTSFGGALDLGALYVDEVNEINYAIVVRNVGTQFTSYTGLKEELPTELILGVSQQLAHVPIRWHITLENMQQWNVAFSNPARAQNSIDGTSTPEKVSFFNNALRHLIVGAELFPKKGFNIRLSYNFRRGEEMSVLEQRNFSGISMGFGLRMRRLKFDYSYSRYTLASNTSMFGLTINFNER
ncbi:MAG: type IX secretion system protein PorQ [Flavobacterium sp.]